LELVVSYFHWENARFYELQCGRIVIGLFWLIFGGLYKRTEPLENSSDLKIQPNGWEDYWILYHKTNKEASTLFCCKESRAPRSTEKHSTTSRFFPYGFFRALMLSLGFTPFAKLLKVIVQSFCQVMNFVLNKPLLS